MYSGKTITQNVEGGYIRWMLDLPKDMGYIYNKNRARVGLINGSTYMIHGFNNYEYDPSPFVPSEWEWKTSVKMFLAMDDVKNMTYDAYPECI